MQNVEEKKKEEQSVKPLDLKDISQLGYVQKTKEVFKGVTMTLQTLSASRQHQILSMLPANNVDALAKYTQMQVETLALATLAINDKKYSEADVDTLRQFYAGLQSKVLQEFYAFYTELVMDQESVLVGLKKT